MKITKLITKIIDLVNTEETKKMEKQIDETEKSKDDSSRMFKATNDLYKVKPKTHLLIKEGNQYKVKKS